MQRIAPTAARVATAVIALIPPLIVVSVRQPRPDAKELAVQLAAGTLPALFFWYATWPGLGRRGTGRGVRQRPASASPAQAGPVGAARAGRTMIGAVLPTIVRFAAAVLAGVAIGAVAEAAAWGLRAALPAVAVACCCTLGSRLLRRDWPSATWPVVGGFGALGVALVIGVSCLAWHVGVDYDDAAVRVIGIAVIAVCCCAGILAAADVRRDRSGRSALPAARGRAG